MDQTQLSNPFSGSQSAFRPGIPTPTRPDLRHILYTALILALGVYWVLSPIWPNINTHILGDPKTDAIRGMWGFDHIYRSVVPPETPIWSTQLNFPAGVVALTLPWVTGILLVPISSIFGPFVAWNLGIALILWALGMSTAWLVKTMTNSWSTGCAMGGMMIAHPMLLYSIGDGTPEHLTLWGIPLVLGALHLALSSESPRWGILAGIFAFLVVMDSPYHAIYTIIMGFAILGAFFKKRSPPQRLELMWSLGLLIGCCAIGAALVAGLYSYFPLEEAQPQEKVRLLKMNALDLRTWWQFEYVDDILREPSLAPTAIPAPILWSSLVLIVIGLPRSLPWFLTGLFMICLSAGLNTNVAIHLAGWIGNIGHAIGNTIYAMNNHLYGLPGLGDIRFPQRWLVPATLSLAVGAGFGLQRLYQLKGIRNIRFGISAALTLMVVLSSVRISHLDISFPSHPLPKVQFAEWIAEQPQEGSVLILPQMRPPPASGKRSDLPVFANISPVLSSADNQYFQVIHRRPVYFKPNLKTLYAHPTSKFIYRLVREWDDLAHPMITGNPIPASAYDSRSEPRRKKALRDMVDAGLRWIVLDEKAYNDEAMGIFKKQIVGYIDQEKRFDDGDGVLIYQLKP